MHFDKVFTTIWSVIILLHLVNAKATIKRRQESSSIKPTSRLPEKYQKQESNSEERSVESVSNPELDDEQNNKPRPVKMRDYIKYHSGVMLSSFEIYLLKGTPGSSKDQLEMAPKVGGINKEREPINQLPNAQENMITNSFGNGVANSVPKWQHGIVLYRIDNNIFDHFLTFHLFKAMRIIEAASCVRFEEISSPIDGMPSIHFTNSARTRECVHTTTLEDNGDVVVTLGLECMKTRDLLHSILHGLGFIDEVTHPHRDQYIRVIWENIQPKYRNLFTINREESDKLVEYDPMSVMHFHDRAFSGNGGLTIAPVMNGLLINPSEKLSQLDVMKLRLAFGHECNKRKVNDIVKNCKNVLYKKTAGNESKEDSDNTTDNDKESVGDSKESKDNSDSKTDKGNENNYYSDTAKKLSDVDASENDQTHQKVKIQDLRNKKEVADNPISDGDDLTARRFPSHLKFVNIPHNIN